MNQTTLYWTDLHHLFQSCLLQSGPIQSPVVQSSLNSCIQSGPAQSASFQCSLVVLKRHLTHNQLSPHKTPHHHLHSIFLNLSKIMCMLACTWTVFDIMLEFQQRELLRYSATFAQFYMEIVFPSSEILWLVVFFWASLLYLTVNQV